MKCLHDGGERCEEYDAGEEERYLARPSRLVKGRVIVFREQSKDVVNRI